MANLIIIDGTSGIWKNDLVEYITNRLVDSELIIKTTTRKKHKTDLKVDLVFVEQIDVSEFEYVYKYNGYIYAFKKCYLEEALRKNKNVFLIIRNIDIIHNIFDDFKKINIVTIFIYTDMHRIRNRIKIKDGDKLELSIKKALDDYLRNPQIYNLVLINGATQNEFFRLIDYSIEFANEFSSFRKKTIFIPKVIKNCLQIVLPIYDALLTGLAINSITSSPIGQWNIICFVLAIFNIFFSLIFQWLINISK